MQFLHFGSSPQLEVDPHGLVGHSAKWQLGSRHGCLAAMVSRPGKWTPSRRWLHLTVTVSGISGLSCARWLLGYSDGSADV
jgi:hypothetical protein